MSWFDATGIANLAKSALKEAQKTIDKALDIKEEEQRRVETQFNEGKAGSDNTDFFAEWGIKNEENREVKSEAVTTTAKEKSTASTIWGSFAGSFFENPGVSDDAQSDKFERDFASVPQQNADVQDSRTNALATSDIQHSSLDHLSNEWQAGLVTLDPSLNRVSQALVIVKGDTSSENRARIEEQGSSWSQTASDSFEDPLLSHIDTYEPFKKLEALGLGASNDAINDESFSNTQLIVELDEDGVRTDGDEAGKQSLGYRVREFTSSAETVEAKEYDNRSQRRRSSDETVSEDSKKIVVVRRKELNNMNRVTNRISVVSSESDKKSSESVEVLGSRSSLGTDCTTTPESDINSIGNSTSSSAIGTRVNSDSVEILPDCSSLTTSPSSVEILGEWKSDSSPFVSPIEADQLLSFISRPMDLPLGERQLVNVTQDAKHTENTEEWRNSGSTLVVSPCQSSSDDNNTVPDLPVTFSVNQSTVPLKLTSEPDQEDVSPQSVEVITDIESEEPSLADDSYTSASESTVLLTVMEGNHSQPDRSKPKLAEFIDRSSKMHDSCPDTRQSVLRPNLADTQLNLSLDSLKEKHNFRLNLTPITTQPIRKAVDSLEFEVLDPLKSLMIEPPDPDTFQDSIAQLQRNESPISQELQQQQQQQQHDVAPNADHSSCEGTLIESSSDDNATLVCQVEPKIIDTATLTASSYVTNMLAEAMVEKIEAIDSGKRRTQTENTRDASPISSER